MSDSKPPVSQPDVSEEFDGLARQWEEHCHRVRFSSNLDRYLDHDAFRGIVALGRPAIPLIIERYRTSDLLWGFVLEEITGLSMVEDRNRFSPSKMQRRWIEWWEGAGASSSAGDRRDR